MYIVLQVLIFYFVTLCLFMPDNRNYQQFSNFDINNYSDILSPSDNVNVAYRPQQSFYSPHEFNHHLLHYDTGQIKQSFCCLHINCRSLRKNFDNMTTFLDSIHMQFSVICLTETWLKQNDPLCRLDEYTFKGNFRKEKSGGGVGIFIKEHITVKCREDLDIYTDFIESIFIEIQHDYKNIIVGVVYRPPGQPVQPFLDALNLVIDIVNKEKKLFYLLGDFNIDLAAASSCQYSDAFLDLCMTNSMYPLIHYPTRITSHSATLLDNIFTNDFDVLSTGAFLVDISDHFPIFCICENQIVHKRVLKINRREIKEENINLFINKLKGVSWIYSGNDPNHSYECFFEQFFLLYDDCFPIKHVTVSRKHKPKPWFTKKLRKLCKKRWTLYKQFIKNPTEYREKKYKKYRNMVTYELRRAKQDYYKEKFSGAIGDIKKTWNIIGGILSKKKKSLNIQNILYNNHSVSDKPTMCQIFNDYFVNIGYNLTKDLQSSSNDFTKYLKRNECSAYFKPITCKEIIDIVCNMKNDTSAGFDGVTVKIIKRVIHLICIPLCNIFNMSMTEGIFPEKLKIAKVVPVYKNGSYDEITNYRPISVLCIFSKIIERCFYNRLSCFLTQCNIISENQYGFREGHSTSSALADFIHKVSTALDNRQSTIGLFLDLSKAFDTLDHGILLKKLEIYGIRGIILNWFKSYLSNRKQYVKMDNYQSQMNYIQCGVPQGSILGPLLFILYINDICHVSNILQFILFADDTSVYLSHENLQTLQLTFNTELVALTEWFNTNRLILNVNKTNFMIFSNKKCNFDNITLTMNNTSVSHVSTLKFLGVTIDHKLSWHNHISDVCNKVSRNIGIMSKLKMFPTNILKMLYYSLIYPYLNYCNIAWANSRDYYMTRLFKLHKRAIRVVSKVSFYAHTQNLFIDLKMLNLFNINFFNIAIFMYLCSKKKIPIRISTEFHLNSAIHNYSTRNSINFHIPMVRTLVSKNSIFFPRPNDLEIHSFHYSK